LLAATWTGRIRDSGQDCTSVAAAACGPANMDELTGRYYFYIIRNMKTKVALVALSALAQEDRLAAFRLLVVHAPEGLPAGTIAQRLGVPPPTLSFHLKELSHAGLIAAHPQGRFIWYRAELEAMNGLVRYLTEHCCSASGACNPVCAPAGTRAGTGARRMSTPGATRDAPTTGCPPAAVPVAVQRRSRA
jgi:DNA-binding transcriptional ArsR family regulator